MGGNDPGKCIYPESYWDRPSALPLVGLEPTEVTAFILALGLWVISSWGLCFFKFSGSKLQMTLSQLSTGFATTYKEKKEILLVVAIV